MLKIVFSQGTIGRCVKGQDGHQANISSPENRLISGTVPCFGDISSLLSFLLSDLFSIMGENCGTTCSGKNARVLLSHVTVQWLTLAQKDLN